MLPDASTGQSPDTLAEKLSRCKEGMAHFLPSGYKFCELYACRGTSLIGAAKIITGYKMLVRHWSSVAVQTISEPEIYHGAGIKLRADARVRVQEPLQICLGAGAKAKSVTSNLPILSVL